MSQKAFGLTFFCEDFRTESTGKHMYIGVYTAVMNVHVPFPFVIPKFVFMIHYAEQPHSFSDDLVFRIFLPGDPDNTPSIEVSAPKELREQKTRDETLSADDEPLLRMFIPVVAQPLVLKQEGRIRVRAVCGDFTAKLGTLRVRQKLAQLPPFELKPTGKGEEQELVLSLPNAGTQSLTFRTAADADLWVKTELRNWFAERQSRRPSEPDNQS